MNLSEPHIFLIPSYTSEYTSVRTFVFPIQVHIGKFMQLFLVQLLHQWLMFLRGVADINPLRGRRFLVSFPV